MELGRTENSEIIFIQTHDLEVTIKGGASGDPPPFVTPDQLESSITFACKSRLQPAIRGRTVGVNEGTLAGRCTAPVLCDPIFFRQKSDILIAEAYEGCTLEFDYVNVL